MNPLHRALVYLLVIFLASACQKGDKGRVSADYIYRRADEHPYALRPSLHCDPPVYPWEEGRGDPFPRISKDFFRCKGCPSHPPKALSRQGRATIYFKDCFPHSLPLKEESEFIYPTLIALLNHVQKTLQARVVITCGHRCPEHNAFSDPTPYNYNSKHMIGAEVDFYVEGLENEPMKVLEALQDFYQQASVEYRRFERFNSAKLNVSTAPWQNKEIFIKLYLPNEGRDFDNQHPYPYIGLQIRYDPQTQTRVVYEAKQAQNFLRY